jgi:hypothetical protein
MRRAVLLIGLLLLIFAVLMLALQPNAWSQESTPAGSQTPEWGP